MKMMNWVAAAILAMAVSARGASDRCLVMVSVDGLAGFYMDDPKAEMPNIRALAKEGARAASMRAVAPTVTWPNHTTLVTGDYPARHGVVGNNFYDRTTGKQVVLIWDPVMEKEGLVRVPTIYDVAKGAGLTTAAVRWPASRGAKTLDWTTPDVIRGDLFARDTTPVLIKEWEGKIGVDGSKEGGKPPEHIEISGEEDGEVARGFVSILKNHRPNLGLVHLLNVDHVEHAKGPRTAEAYAAIKAADAQVGEIWEELKKDFPGKGTMVIVSDHGFSPIEHAILPNVILREAGLIDVKGMRVVGGKVKVVPQGGTAMVYVTEDADRAAIVEKVRTAFDGVKGIDKVVGREGMAEAGFGEVKQEDRSPDVLLMAKMGWTFGDTAAGALAFVDKPEKSGTHGHNPDLPDLHATFVVWGAGVKGGASVGEIRNVDVAPTVARLLGVEMKDVDGRVIEGVLEK